jgi:transcriptional regulator with XRE-family HTH domain
MKNRIAEVLKERNMKQIELARQLNVGRSRVSMWCSSSSTPNILMLMRISDVLNVQLTELLADKANLKENQSNGI